MDAKKIERIEELLNGLANDAHMLSHGRDLVTGDTLSTMNMQGIGLTMRNNIYEVWRLVRGVPAASSLEMAAVSSAVGLAQLLRDFDVVTKETLQKRVKEIGDTMFERGFNWAEPDGIEFSDVLLVMQDLGIVAVVSNVVHENLAPRVVDKFVEFGYGMFAYGRNRAANVGA